MHIDKHPEGDFCWVELATTDQNAAKQFYGNLFGWKPNDQPLGPGQIYTIFQLEGRQAAACHGMLEPGTPPNWLLYIAVDNADVSAARIKKAGGNVVMGPNELPGTGKMAVIQDPTGAFFSIFQPGGNSGLGIAGVDGTLCWADLNTADRMRAKKFYEESIGWRLLPGQGKDESTYLHIKNGEKYIGGILPDDYRNKNAPAHWLPYFTVSDCDAAAARVKELGGKVYMPPMTIEGSLRYAVVADPQGAVFALFTQLPRA